jgi:hypothetical protein
MSSVYKCLSEVAEQLVTHTQTHTK